MKEGIDTDDIPKMMAGLAGAAVEFTSEAHQIALDHTPESIQQVESIVASVAETVPRGFLQKLLRKGPLEEEIQANCQMFGAYLGEVMRENLPGDWKWEMNAEMGTIGLTFDGSWCFPTNKIYKRIMDGPGDDLWSYYRVLLHMALEGKL